MSMATSDASMSSSLQSTDSAGILRARHGHETNIRRTARYAAAAFALSLAGNIGHVILTTSAALPAELIVGKAATAAVGPALIGTGLELWIRRPPAVIGDRALPLVGTWRDFPIVGYVVVMMIGFALSFDHLRALAELVGVPDWAAWLLPIGIDLAAISVTLDHAQSKRALDRLAAEQIGAVAAAQAEADRGEVERAERARWAEIESRRLATEQETARLAAKAESDRRLAAEAHAERARLEDKRTQADATSVNAQTARRAGAGTTAIQGEDHAEPDRSLASVQAANAEAKGPKASKRDLARDWLLEFGVESTNADVIAGLGWAGTAGDRKAIQRARAALKSEVSALGDREKPVQAVDRTGFAS